MIRSVLSGVGIVAGLFAVAAGAGETAERQADLDAISLGERNWTRAYVTGDSSLMAPLLSDRFHGIRVDGTAYGKAEALEAMRKEPHDSSDEISEFDVQFFGDTAIATIREKDIGSGPEYKPYWRVITDTWIKADGRWQVVAAEELDPGSPTFPAHGADVARIRDLRAASNRAIAAHDMAAFLPCFAEDAVFVWGNGLSAVGRSALQSFFAHDFADPAFVEYVRAPERVSVSEAGVRAVEHGTWTALKREARGETRYGGDYMAHWFKSPEGWQIRGEVYVKLRCSGPLCIP